MKTRRAHRPAACWTFLMIVGCAKPPGTLVPNPDASNDAHLTILQLNDVYEVTPVEGGKVGGLARVATLAQRFRRTNPNVWIVLAGDFLSPSAIGTAMVDGERLAGRQMVAALNAVGLDLVTFGNHEFDISKTAFDRRVAESRFSYVSSNVFDSAGHAFPGVSRHRILTISNRSGRPFRVGVVAATIDVNRQPWVRYTPFIAAIQQEIQLLRDSADVFIALTHLTIAQDQMLAEAVPELALILGGHEHENVLLRRGSRLTPIVKADANARTIAVIDLRYATLSHRTTISTELLPVTDSVPEDPIVAGEVTRWVNRAFASFRASGFEPTETVAILPIPLDGREASIRNHSTALTDLIAAAMLHEVPGAEIALFNAGSIRIDDQLPPSAITQYDVIRVLPFGGNVVSVEMKGSLLRRVLDQGEANRGSGGFLQHANIGTDPTTGWKVGTAMLDPMRTYRVAIIDFLLTGVEQKLGFLKRGDPDLRVIGEFRDIRLAAMAELRRAYPPQP